MMRYALAGALAAAWLAAGACARGAAPKRASAPADTVAYARQAAPPAADSVELDSLIRQTMSDLHLVGLSVGVAQDGKIVLARGYGMASLQQRAPVTAQTMFAVGSVTKQFACAALLLLAQDGKVRVDDTVATWLPTLTRAGSVTLLELGQHVAGYRDYYPLDFVDREMERPTTADDLIREYATRPLDFDPGTKWSYSNTNFIVLGRVIEKASGQPFGTFLSQRLFGPLGLRHTAFEPAPGSEGMATGYTTWALGNPVRVAPEAPGWAGAAGAIWSTPTDLLTWDLALADGKVISPASYRLMTTPRRLPDGRSTGYGCGEFVDTRGAAMVVSHGGAVSGFTAENTVIPSTRSAVVLLTNSDFGALGDLNDAIVSRLLPKPVLPAIEGSPAVETALRFLLALRAGKVDRTMLGDDFNAYLTPYKIGEASVRLGYFGFSDLRLVSKSERGGMELAVLRLRVGSTPTVARMFRTPDGKIQQFLMYRRGGTEGP